MKGHWIQVGVISVDAGLCWLGDPCYIMHKEGERVPKDLGADWGDFVLKMCDKSDSVHGCGAQFNHNAGHPGLGVCVPTGYGDGVYPVEVKLNREGRVKAVRVKFC